MFLLSKLWNDERGGVVAAETVLVGSVGVAGAVAGLNAVSTSVNDELKELSCAIRSLDQSYTIPARSSCGAWTAGSSYVQPPVEVSLKALREKIANPPVVVPAPVNAAPVNPAVIPTEKLPETMPGEKKAAPSPGSMKEPAGKELPRAPREEERPQQRRSDERDHRPHRPGERRDDRREGRIGLEMNRSRLS